MGKEGKVSVDDAAVTSDVPNIARADKDTGAFEGAVAAGNKHWEPKPDEDGEDIPGNFCPISYEWRSKKRFFFYTSMYG